MSGEVTESNEGAALEQGTYEIVRDRLIGHARELGERADALNRKRLELFGGSELAVVGSERIRTQNNCIPRDIVGVGDDLLFGYNVFIGLRQGTQVADVLSLHRFVDEEGALSFHHRPEAADTFLGDPGFLRDFEELLQYYREAQLDQLRALDGRLLAVFRTGQGDDTKVFRWSVASDGALTYVDNRGERDHVFPPSHDFEWTATTRDDHVDGRHPHVSIADEIFVETLGGALTIKIENNTDDGLGVYREPVEDGNQSLEDAEIRWARVGSLILLSILPYRETERRYLVFNTRTKQVTRIDAIGQACVELPEDHGIIFPGGYYLETGETRSFEGDVAGMQFSRRVRSPNGEDVLYVFYEKREGRRILLPYNTIRKEVQNPIVCHGYSLFDDGRMVIFRDHASEPSRVHTMQIWQTPFTSIEVAAAKPSTGSYLETVGNPDLVRAISDAFSLRRAVERQEPSRRVYEEVIASADRMLDGFHWIGNAEVGDLGEALSRIREAAELVIDEFEKVEALRAQADQALAAAEADLDALIASLRPEQWDEVDAFVAALAKLRRKRGELIGLRDRRQMRLPRVAELEARVVEHFDALSRSTVGYLLGEAALAPYQRRIEEVAGRADGVAKVAEADPLLDTLEELSGELDVLTEVVGTLQIDDATQRTRIFEDISEIFAAQNRAKALVESRRKELLSSEGSAEFAAQFKLFGQAVTSALGLADSPERCDEQLGRLMIQLEELEGRFGEFEHFLDELTTKREDVYEAFSARKQSLLDERARHGDRLMKAAERILEGIARRAGGLDDPEELAAYFASDPMVMKLRDQVERLRELEDVVRADELESRLKSSREEAARAQRDRRDIYEDGNAVIVLGRHRFSVNTQRLDATLVPRDGEMALHLTGTDFASPVEDEAFQATRPFWDQHLVSETAEVYRGEYLAACALADAEAGRDGLDLAALRETALTFEPLRDLVRSYAAQRYDEGYERGLHDEDGARILAGLLQLHGSAGLLRFAPRPRALAALFWAEFDERTGREQIERRARSLGRMRRAFARSSAVDRFCSELGETLRIQLGARGIEVDAEEAGVSGTYLFEELATDSRGFVASAEAESLLRAFGTGLESAGGKRELEEDLRSLEKVPAARYDLARSWLGAFCERSGDAQVAALAPALEEAAVWLVTERRISRVTSRAHVSVKVAGLLGQHPRIAERSLSLRLDEFLARLGRFRRERAPGYRAYQGERGRVLEAARAQLRLSEFEPRVMSSFVRNRLIDQVYLPLIGDNLAKQIGAAGDAKRTDNMGLLLLISPPGYGKTMLMEYIADRLGLVFVKANGPALGHGVTSLDPAAAPDAAARQEVEKINLAFEMGNNVLLYLDDIQHTSSELLQKFISLCDGQRRVEGVWNGRTRTYDLRGKRFAVCMAGNPYTESGAKFEIPDMLANRADIYNLGDVLSGRHEFFALSYLENCLTSNPVLSPLTTRDLADVGHLVRMARGDAVAADELSHAYSSVELEEILSVLRKLERVQQVLLAVNGEYIRSASMDDAFRTEPSFKLQGSYRNMNKIAEKIVAVMNDEELEALIDDHYQGEAQTLTSGAEHNLLKLAELRGRLAGEAAERWQQILRDFRRVKALGGEEDDPATRVTSQLSLVNERLEDLAAVIRDAAAAAGEGLDAAGIGEIVAPMLDRLGENLSALSEAHAVQSAPIEVASPAPTSDEALHELVGSRLDAVARRLGEIGDSIAIASGDGDDGADGEIGPYLDRLDATLRAVVSAPRGGEVIQALSPGVKELIDKMVVSIGDTLLPLLRAIDRRAGLGDDDHRLRGQMNRTLKNFDMLKDLLEALRKIDTRELLRRSRTQARNDEPGEETR